MADAASLSLVDLDSYRTPHHEVPQPLCARQTQRRSWSQDLPLNVFCDILIIFRDGVFSSDYSSKKSALPRLYVLTPWIALSHVCQGWRTASLDYPPFWSTIPINNIRWTEELLIRSKNTPLAIRPVIGSLSQMSFTSHMESFYLALRESHRIKELFFSLAELIFSPDIQNFVIKTFLHCSFPELQKMRIFSVRFTALPSSDYQNYRPPLAREFLCNIRKWLPAQFSSLTIPAASLFAINPPLQSNLTYLLVVDESRNFAGYSMNMLLDIMGNLPVLEHLILRCILQNDLGTQKIDQRCSLLCLKYLEIALADTPLRHVSAFINHIATPSGSKIAIRSSAFTFYNEDDDEPPADRTEGAVTARKKELEEGVGILFSSLSSYSTPEVSQFIGRSQPRKQAFQSMLIDASSWNVTFALSRSDKLELRGKPHGDISDSPQWLYNPHLGISDISIELGDEHLLYGGSERDHQRWGEADSLVLLPTNVVFPFTLNLFHSTLHIFLSETMNPQLPACELTVARWVHGLAGATHLRDLELRVSEQTLQLLMPVLYGWEGENHAENQMTLPCLESMTFWEYGFQSPLFASRPTVPSALHLRLQHEQHPSNQIISPFFPESQDPTSYILNPFRLSSTTSEVPRRRLIDALADRREAGHPLRQLSFRACSNFSVDVVREYEKVVDEVIWDGVDHMLLALSGGR
ncbi:hypothetical protein DL96DRAFT_860244 [Flagelloscypha sp. PMI_526]|nr:hypothetical protein DL96DRAFT_860244 [Flagelloscypha sp. PMI_526]